MMGRIGLVTTAIRDRRPLARAARLVDLAIVAGCCAFVLVQLDPALVLRDTTAAGGDMGAHVWFPAYLRDHLLGDLRVAGWSDDLFAGFPAGQFYFPLPALGVVVLDVALPYNVAFKLVTVLGAVLLPAAAAVALAGLRAPRPTPALAAAGATAFLFFTGSPHAGDAQTVAFNQRIMGGTLASTLAGEFSFTIALALALAFLGALAWSLDRRRMLWLPALLGAAVVLSHVIVAIFAVFGALVVWATRRPVRNAAPTIAIGIVAALLTAVWTLPLAASLSYTAHMRYEPITDYVRYLFPGYLAWMLPFVAVALGVGIARRRRSTLVVALLTVVAAGLFRFWEDVSFAPVWNLRMLPFWYLGLFLLTAVGAAELARGAGLLAARAIRARDEAASTEATLVPEAGAAMATDGAEAPVEARAERWRVHTVTAVALVVALGTLVQVHETRSFLPFWARWNYSGIEETGPGGIGKSYPEHRALLETMGELPPGRAAWEPTPDLDRYGTPLALTVLPYHTDGRIGSLEGLYYESSATTPYAFLTIANLAAPGNASNPVRGLRYGTIDDFALGISQLQALGVRYYLAHSEEARAAAAADDRLRRVATVDDLDPAPEGWADAARGERPLVEAEPPGRVFDVTTDARGVSFRVSEPGVAVIVNVEHSTDWQVDGAEGPFPVEPRAADEATVVRVVPTTEQVALRWSAPPRGWEVYEVAGSELVEGLANEPVIVEGLRSRPSAECYEVRDVLGSRAEDLDPWECVAAPWWDDPEALAVPLASDGPASWARVRDVRDARARPLPAVEVSDVEATATSVSFRVDEPGIPVVVKVSAYPNWQAEGAEGPWRLSPNLQVVVPTEDEVTLRFATTAAEHAGRALGLVGLVGLALLVWWVPGRRPARVTTMARPAADSRAGS